MKKRHSEDSYSPTGGTNRSRLKRETFGFLTLAIIIAKRHAYNFSWCQNSHYRIAGVLEPSVIIIINTLDYLSLPAQTCDPSSYPDSTPTRPLQFFSSLGQPLPLSIFHPKYRNVAKYLTFLCQEPKYGCFSIDYHRFW